MKKQILVEIETRGENNEFCDDSCSGYRSCADIILGYCDEYACDHFWGSRLIEIGYKARRCQECIDAEKKANELKEEIERYRILDLDDEIRLG